MDIKTDAPVVARAEAQVAADPQTVWSVLTDLEGWPRWNEKVRSLALSGPLAVGSTFRWKSGPGTIKSMLGEVDALHKIAWSGQTMGIKAIDVFRLEARDGGTYVTEEESWDGFTVRLLRGRMQRTLQDSLDEGLRSLRYEAEQKASSPQPNAA
jgi:uncharacterized protein YndB with AHSA1/START domain